MSTSQATSFLSEIASGAPIPLHKLAYFRARTRNRLYDYVIGMFLEREKAGLTRAELARRIGKRPEVISRLLGAPGNWTIETVSDLLLGIDAQELEPNSSSVLNRVQRNFTAHDLFVSQASELKTEEASGRFKPVAGTPALSAVGGTRAQVQGTFG